MKELELSHRRGGGFNKWFRVLRPLVCWMLLVICMYGYRQHTIWLAQTRLVFSVSLEGKSDNNESEALIDGSGVLTGGPVTLGSHTFTVKHRKGVTFETNLFVWYGENNLGRIDMARKKGTLAVSALPPAPLLSIHGPEFSLALTNSRGWTSEVPTDVYRIEARYLHWEKTEQATLTEFIPARVAFAPRLGEISLFCDQNDATFQLSSVLGSVEEKGSIPATLSGLPEGRYRVATMHHGNSRSQVVEVKAGETNDVAVQYRYGSALVESVPSGAHVVDANGRQLGVTPLNIPELASGRWEFTLRLEGYEPLSSSLAVTANGTARFQTSLVNSSYLAVMNSGRQYLAARNYQRASEAAAEALRIQPNDAQATVLQREVTGRFRLEKAKETAAKGDYAGAKKQLDEAADLLPGDTEVRSLSQEYARRSGEIAADAERKAEVALAEKNRLERLNGPSQYFDEWMKGKPNSRLFVTYEQSAQGRIPELESKLVNALTNTEPPFTVLSREHPKPEMVAIEAKMSLGTGGWRRCDLVVGQTTEDTVTILFKVFEYAYPESFSIRAVAGLDDENQMLPIHSARIDSSKTKLLSRRAEGANLVKGRIQDAASH